MRTIGVVTGSRSDYGSLVPILRQIQIASDCRLHLMVSGMHLSPEFGSTVESIEEDGFEINERIEMLLSSDTPEGIAKSMGLGTLGFAQAFSRFRPDLLLVLGDRYEMHAAALAALPFKIPVAHVHGGELTFGAIDDSLRHSMTKLSHLHFVATKEYARRVIQMGEESWRVVVSGAPGLDNLTNLQLLSREELFVRYGLKWRHPPFLVTYHPVTLEYEQTEVHVKELLKALRIFERDIIFTAPNADTGGQVIHSLMEDFIRQSPTAQLVTSLGTQAYWSLMKQAVVMVGNSSSGLIEAPSFHLPVVNIGTRQQGRTRGANVIDVGYRSEEIVAGIQKAISPEFRLHLNERANPYGDGHASQRIVKYLREISLDDELIRKHFVDASISADQVVCYG